MKVLKSIRKEIGSEIRFDTWYHIVLSLAVIIKIVFICSAIFCFIEQKKYGTDTKEFKRAIHIKDIANELTILIICLIMIYVFNPFNNTFCIDKHFKTLLFVFAIFAIAEIHWVVFTSKVSPDANIVQFFLGRIGTMQQQEQRDREHAAYYDNVEWN